MTERKAITVMYRPALKIRVKIYTVEFEGEAREPEYIPYLIKELNRFYGRNVP